MEKRRNEWKKCPVERVADGRSNARDPVKVGVHRDAESLTDVRKQYEAMSKQVKPLTNEPGHAP